MSLAILAVIAVGMASTIARHSKYLCKHRKGGGRPLPPRDDGRPSAQAAAQSVAARLSLLQMLNLADEDGIEPMVLLTHCTQLLSSHELSDADKV